METGTGIAASFEVRFGSNKKLYVKQHVQIVNCTLLLTHKTEVLRYVQWLLIIGAYQASYCTYINTRAPNHDKYRYRYPAVFWNRDVLIRIRIRGSVPLDYGYGSGSGFGLRIRIRLLIWTTNTDPAPELDSDPALFFNGFQNANKDFQLISYHKYICISLQR